MEHKDLATLAVKAREHSYAPYSNFCVGAALLAENGEVYTGCNIENAAYSPTNCAERTAIFNAISQGVRKFEAIAVAGWPQGGSPSAAFPCGVCRQVLMEFVQPDTFTVLVCTDEHNFTCHTLASLLPQGFGPASLS